MTVARSRRRQAFENAWNGFDQSTNDQVIEQDVEIAGTRVRLSIRGAELAGILLPALRPRWAQRMSGFEDVRIRVWAGTTLHGTQSSTALTGVGFVPRGKAAPREDDGITVAYAPESTMLSMWDSTTERGVFWIEDLSMLPSWERSAPLVHLFHWLEAERRHALVHAAAIGRRGKGLLLVGAGGAGKSTAALACLEAGFDYVADDYCLVSIDDGPRAHNLYGSGKLTPDSAAHLLTLSATKIAVRSEDGKHILDIGQFRSSQIVDHLDLVGVVLPSIGEHPTEPILVSSMAAGRVLIPSTTLQLSALRPEAVGVIAQVLRDVPVFELGFGPDRGHAPRQLDALLAELCTVTKSDQ